jgi:hypothetical protein
MMSFVSFTTVIGEYDSRIQSLDKGRFVAIWLAAGKPLP